MDFSFEFQERYPAVRSCLRYLWRSFDSNLCIAMAVRVVVQTRGIVGFPSSPHPVFEGRGISVSSNDLEATSGRD